MLFASLAFFLLVSLLLGGLTLRIAIAYNGNIVNLRGLSKIPNSGRLMIVRT
jgi:hypothetical protein